MQKIKELLEKIKKAVKKPTKKQKIIAYIVLGALIVGITVPAVYLNRGSLFKGQFGSFQNNYYDGGEYDSPNSEVKCTGKVIGYDYDKKTATVEWTGNGYVNGIPLKDDIVAQFKVLYFQWDLPQGGSFIVTDWGTVRNLSTLPDLGYSLAKGWRFSTNGHGTIVDQSAGGKKISATYDASTAKTVTATIHGGVIHSKWSFDINSIDGPVGKANVTNASVVNTVNTCSVAIQAIQAPPEISCKAIVAPDGYTVTWINDTPNNSSFSVGTTDWELGTFGGTYAGPKNVKTLVVKYKPGMPVVLAEALTTFKYLGKGKLLSPFDETDTGNKWCSAKLTGDDIAAQAAADQVTQKASEIAKYLKTADDALKKVQAALDMIENGHTGIIGVPQQLTPKDVQDQITAAKTASEAADYAWFNTQIARNKVIDSYSKIPDASPSKAAAKTNWTTAIANAKKVQTDSLSAYNIYKQAVTAGNAKISDNAARDKNLADLLVSQANQPKTPLNIGPVSDPGYALKDITITNFGFVQDKNTVKFNFDLSNSSNNAGLDAQILDDRNTTIKTLDHLTDAKNGTISSFVWDSAVPGTYTFVVSGNDGIRPISQQKFTFTVDNSAIQQKTDAQKADELAAQLAAQQKAAAEAAAAQLAAQQKAAADAAAAAAANANKTSPPTNIYPTDISGHWAESIIQKAVNLGVVVTNANGLFNPDQPITRADVAVMAMRALAQTPTPCTNVQCGTPFVDNVGYLVTAGYIAKANSLGIIVNAQNFRPYATLTRAEAASILAKMIKYKDPTFHLRTPAECYYHATWHWSCGAGWPDNIATDINADWEGQYFRSLWDYSHTIFQGKAPHIYAPEDPITNAEMLKIIMNAVHP